MTSALSAPSLLASARRAHEVARAAEAEVFEAAVAWCVLHEETDPDAAATWGDSPVPLAGEGAPFIGEFCIAEFAAAVGMSTNAGRIYLTHVLELSARLPRTLAQLRTGRLAVWRARRIADATLGLSMPAAAYVDAQVAFAAHKISNAALQRLVDEATARFMPDLAAEIADRAADGRHVNVHHHQVSFAGTSRVEAELDLADALDLEAAVASGAAQLADLGCTDSLDARRARALGAIARGEQTLELPPPSRAVTLVVHLQPETEVAYLEQGKHLLTHAQVRTWCGTAGSITIKPVIDLHDQLSITGYTVPDRIRDHVTLRDRTCVFPWCERAAINCDLDHIEPYDPDGPGEQTSTLNLAPLCRRHHRLKTHGNWTYTMVEPGTYLWRSPLGQTYLTDTTGSRDLTPRPVDPPGLQRLSSADGA